MHIFDVLREGNGSIKNIVEKFYELNFLLRLKVHLILSFLSTIHVHPKNGGFGYDILVFTC